MPFWTYMLHCRGGRLYTGHTDDLERRIAQHQDGTCGGFTSDYAPCELVWSDEFPSRYEALEAERRIKGWSKAKKLALIRGDWEAIQRLARNRQTKPAPSLEKSEGEPVNPVRPERVGSEAGAERQRLQFSSGTAPKEKDGASTGSARTEDGAGETMQGVLAAPGRLDKALAQASGLSRERVKALIAGGAVQVDGAAVSGASAKVAGGETYAIELPPLAPLDTPAQDIPLDVVFEDDHLIVVNKPAGLVVHPAAGNLDGTLVNALLHHCAGRLSGINGTLRPGIVHRIDKDTSGLLVVAKSDAAHEGLARQFADHSISRTYLAVCAGHPSPPAGTISGRIGRSDANRKKMAVLPDDSSRGKLATTHYKTLEKLDNCALVECHLETGRTHQVRVHLSSIGHPLLGDPAYGRTPPALRPLLKALGFARQALHAASLGFDHPVTGERVYFHAEAPPDMRELIDKTAH